MLGTTLEVHKGTAGAVVKEICEAVITLMRPTGKETGEFPLKNYRICKEDVWMLWNDCCVCARAHVLWEHEALLLQRLPRTT